MTQELYEYIKREIDKGISRASIKESLLASGWQESVINEAINKVAGENSASVVPQGVNSLSFRKTFRFAWGIYKPRIFSLAVISAIPYLIGALLFSIFFGISFVSQIFGAEAGTAIKLSALGNLGLFFVPLLLFIVLVIINQFVVIYAVSNNVGIFSAYRGAFRNLKSFLWVFILNTLIVIGGYMLLVVPGVIFSFWFVFSLYVLAAENEKGRNALLKSKEYVSGSPGKVVWFFFLFVILVVATSLLLGFVLKLLPDLFGNAIGGIFNFLIVAPFAIAFTASLYKNLRSIKSNVTVADKPKRWLTVFAVLGLILAFVPAIAGFASYKYLGKFILQGSTSLSYNLYNLDETANWKVYRNDKYGFEIKYPDGWRINDYSFTYQDVNTIGISVISPIRYDIEGYEKPGALYGAGVSLQRDGELKFDQGRFIKVKEGNEQEPKLISLDESFLKATEEYKTGQKIIATFKFIDETADWKTYRNEKYGFEFRYPSKYFLHSDNSNIGFGAVQPALAIERYSQAGLEGGEFIILTLLSNPSGLGLLDWLKMNRTGLVYGAPLNSPLVEVGGVDAIRYSSSYSGPYDGAISSEAVFGKDNIIFHFWAGRFFDKDGELQDDADKILSTFRFISQGANIIFKQKPLKENSAYLDFDVFNGIISGKYVGMWNTYSIPVPHLPDLTFNFYPEPQFDTSIAKLLGPRATLNYPTLYKDEKRAVELFGENLLKLKSESSPDLGCTVRGTATIRILGYHSLNVIAEPPFNDYADLGEVISYKPLQKDCIPIFKPTE